MTSTLNRPKKVSLEGRGTLTLSASHYVTSGGEGAIYRVGNDIIKIYADPEKMRRDGMIEKIRLLSAIQHPFIVAPRGIVTVSSGEPIGYHMPFALGEPLPRVFTNDFRHRSGFSDASAMLLVDGMRTAVDYAHHAGAILVDANEFNWIAVVNDPAHPTPRIIDVDSWAIGKFGASVIMPSIRDRHTKGFTTLSDWFAWGVVTFQVFTGIHPYKGKIPGFGPGDLESRMAANKSVFTPGVQLNRAVRDLSVIPPKLLSWYEAVFQSGERSMPPSPLDAVAAPGKAATVLRVVASGNSSLVFEKLLGGVDDPVVRVWPSGIAATQKGTLIDLSSKRTIGKISEPNAEVVRVSGGLLVLYVREDLLRGEYIAEATNIATPLELPARTSGIFRANERVFAITEKGIAEIVFFDLGKPLLAFGNQYGAPERSSQFFEGVGIYDALGAKFLILPFGEGSCKEVRTRELDGKIVLSGKAGERYVVVVSGDKSGTYERHTFVFDRDHSAYHHSATAIDSPEANVCILPKGVVASIEEDGELVLFVPSNGNVARIKDRHIATDMRLTRWGDKVLYIEGGALWSLRMK